MGQCSDSFIVTANIGTEPPAEKSAPFVDLSLTQTHTYTLFSNWEPSSPRWDHPSRFRRNPPKTVPTPLLQARVALHSVSLGPRIHPPRARSFSIPAHRSGQLTPPGVQLLPPPGLWANRRRQKAPDYQAAAHQRQVGPHPPPVSPGGAALPAGVEVPLRRLLPFSSWVSEGSRPASVPSASDKCKKRGAGSNCSPSS